MDSVSFFESDVKTLICQDPPVWDQDDLFLLMIILIKLFLNSKLDLIRTAKFVKQLFRIQIQKSGKILLWNQVKFRMEACYSELVLAKNIFKLQILSLKFNSNIIFLLFLGGG